MTHQLVVEVRVVSGERAEVSAAGGDEKTKEKTRGHDSRSTGVWKR